MAGLVLDPRTGTYTPDATSMFGQGNPQGAGLQYPSDYARTSRTGGNPIMGAPAPMLGPQTAQNGVAVDAIGNEGLNELSYLTDDISANLEAPLVESQAKIAEANAGVGDMATMMALKQSIDNFSVVSDPNTGTGTRIGAGIGTGIGTGVGFVLGGGPVGAAVGGAIGGAVGAVPGAILDWWAAKDDLKKQEIEMKARRQDSNSLRNYLSSQQRLNDMDATEVRKNAKYTNAYNKMKAVVDVIKRRQDASLSKAGVLSEQKINPANTSQNFVSGLQGGMF